MDGSALAGFKLVLKRIWRHDPTEGTLENKRGTNHASTTILILRWANAHSRHLAKFTDAVRKHHAQHS